MNSLGVDNMVKGFAREAEGNVRQGTTDTSRQTLRSMAQVSDQASSAVSSHTKGFSREAATLTLTRPEVVSGAFYAPPKPR